MSQAQLAWPELSDSYVSLIESGKRVPPPDVLLLLARKLDCTPEYLASGVSDEVRAALRESLEYAQIALQNGEADEASRQFAKALDHPDLAALPELHYEIRWGNALALEARGQLESAVIALNELVTHLSPIDHHERWAWAHIAICRCNRELGDFSAGVVAGERGLDQLTASRDKWTEPMVMLGATLLTLFYERGDLMQARHFADWLIGRADEADSTTARAAVYWNAGATAERCGDLDEALRLVERALALFGEGTDTRNLARLREDCGRLLLRARPEEAERARELLRQAGRELAGSAAGSVDYSQCMADLARAEIVLGRPDEAVRLATEAVGRLGSGARLQTAGALIVLAQGYARLGQNDDATASLTQAAEQLEGMSAFWHAAQAWFDLAELLGTMGQETQRVEAYRQALRCAGLGS